MHGGFGSTRWSGLGAPKADEEAPADPRAPFGGSGWTGSPGLAADDAEGDDGSEGDAESLGDKPTGRRRRATGPTHPRRTLAALGGSVDVLRDGSGVAHVYAKSERDGYAALGYCMAEDRLWQMDYFRRTAMGRLAELVGARATRQDALVRTAGIPRRAAASASRLDGTARDVLAAFAGGVNAARSSVRPAECERLGYEIEPWTLADSLAIELYLAWSCAAATWPEKILIAQAMAAGGVERARVLSSRSIEFFPASDERIGLWRRIDSRIVPLAANACAGAPTGYVIGRAGAAPGVLDATIELPLMSPSPMYPVCLEMGSTRVVGVAHVGWPGLLAGRNESVGWGFVAARVDDADCVLEELDGIGSFRAESGWQKLHRRRETVRVRDGAPLRIEVSETRNGPLLSELVRQTEGPGAAERPVALALRWGANSLGTALSGLVALARAGTVGEACTAAALLERSPIPLDGVVVDSAGEMARLAGGVRPVRDAAASYPVRGWQSEGRWTGLEPLSPADGSPCGATATVATGAAQSAGAVSTVQEARRRRLQGLVEEMAPGTSMDRIVSDVTDGLAVAVLPAVRGALAEAGDPRVARVAALLASWNGEMDCASGGAAAFYVALVPHLIESLLPESRLGPAARCREIALEALGRLLGGEAQLSDEQRRQVVEAFAAAEAWLARHLGEDPGGWTWGAVHRMAARHPLVDSTDVDEPPAPAAGSACTVLGGAFFGAEPPFEVGVAAAARLVADLSTGEARVEGIGDQKVVHLTERPSAPRLELVPGSGA